MKFIKSQTTLTTALILLIFNIINGNEPQKPNFIFNITDDISARDLGPYGNTFVKTPGGVSRSD